MKALGLEGGLGGAVGCAGGRLRWERGGGGLLGNEAHRGCTCSCCASRSPHQATAVLGDGPKLETTAVKRRASRPPSGTRRPAEDRASANCHGCAGSCAPRGGGRESRDGQPRGMCMGRCLQYGLSQSYSPARSSKRLRNILAETGEGARSTPRPPSCGLSPRCFRELYTTEVAVTPKGGRWCL